MSKYVQISYDAFRKLMDQMKFNEVRVEGTFERVWMFPIANSNFAIRVYSTIGVGESISRKSGTDAIRCLIYDHKENKIVQLEKRVHRTASAMKNTRDRCRELFKHVKKHKCACGGVLIERESKHNHKFLGCSNYPACTNTNNQVTPQLKLKIKQ